MLLDLCLTKQRASDMFASCRKRGYQHKSPENDSSSVFEGVKGMRQADLTISQLQTELARKYKGYNLVDVRQVQRSELNSAAERMVVHAAGMVCTEKQSPVVFFHGTSNKGADGIIKSNSINFANRRMIHGLGAYGSQNAE